VKTSFLFLSLSLALLPFIGCKKQYACVCKGSKILTGRTVDKYGKPSSYMSFTEIPIEYEEFTEKVKEKDAEKSCSSKSISTENVTVSNDQERELTFVNKEKVEVTCEIK
jgi:hypothetical protein